ncbi:DUF4190 domain-containing protein [Actinokineospora diospyrosa]|uniref:DUF4190 domain-containing protein n=1 Tax=Actinokineospora diospyrosa TaxID=103728 RepID=A0ABT1III5_9PSEU|nr:hypothetical protein [Actinokineospora diospyrosa]MCP2272346.1 hypothetical protein [Actinokineospora diospyrosa]
MSQPDPYGQAPAQQPGHPVDPNSGQFPVAPPPQAYAGQQPYGAQQFAPMPQQVVVAQYGPAPQNGPGTGGFVTGLLGLIFVWVPFVGLILAIIGVALSGVGIAKANRGEANNKGLAIAGLTCGAIALATWILLLIAVSSVVV